jgi:hypothetical protein
MDLIAFAGKVRFPGEAAPGGGRFDGLLIFAEPDIRTRL